jgi:SAM-dependent methyltransferase
LSGIHYEKSKELDRLEEVFPGIRAELVGKVVIDFGCGLGYQCAAFALAGARETIGVEIDTECARLAAQRVREQGLSGAVRIERKIPEGLKADIIVSQNSFEHFLDAPAVLTQMREALVSGGKIFITFAPPWYAPWGAHMAFFCRLPWVHLLFPESVIMEARGMFRSDGAQTWRDAGLAKMSLRKFENAVSVCGLRSQFRSYDCVRGLDWLCRSPLRELFVNRVNCVLMSADG